MTKARHTMAKRAAVVAVILGGGLGGLAGCQTPPAGFGGMTLPSPHYLQHPPQYFPPDPVFPLQRELDSMQDNAGLAGAATVSPPTPVVAVPAVPAAVPATPLPR